MRSGFFSNSGENGLCFLDGWFRSSKATFTNAVDPNGFILVGLEKMYDSTALQMFLARLRPRATLFNATALHSALSFNPLNEVGG